MRKGFTLLEVLLALAMMALVVSLIQGAYSGVVRSRDFSRESTRETHGAAFVLHRIADELSMTFVDPARPVATGLVVETSFEGVSSLRFTSRVPPVAGFSSGGDAELAYFLEEDLDGYTVLVRRESDDLDGDLTSGGEEYVLLEEMTRFSVECYDGVEWVEEWDSAERADPPLLPLSVRVSVSWQDEEEESEEESVARVYRTATPIYAATAPP